MAFKRYVDLGIPFNYCNLKCHYCYVQQRANKGGKGHTASTQLEYPIEHVVRALSVERLGGQSIINLCAPGETMLPEYIPELIRGFLKEGHYVTVVTNGTLTDKFREISGLDRELLKKIFFKCSFHLMELKRKGLLDVFFDNIRLIKKMGASFSVEFCAADEIEPYINEIKEICLKEVGAYPHVVIPRSDDTKGLLSMHTLEEFVKIWDVFESPLFDFKARHWDKKRTEFCRAGEYMFLINGGNGGYSKCYRHGVSQNVFEDINKKIIFEPVGCDCRISHCFNSHFFLSLGCIEEIDEATYADMRDRIDRNTGEHWLNDTMLALFSQRFGDYDKESNK